MEKPFFDGACVDERLGAATVLITDPPSDTEAAKNATGRTFRWPGPNHTPAETWSSGHRNPYGLAFDAKGRLWETEMGPRGGDELNLIVQGRNYGWPAVSEGQNYNGVSFCARGPTEFRGAPLFLAPSISPSSRLIFGRPLSQWRATG